MISSNFYNDLPLTECEKEVLARNSYFEPSKFFADKIKSAKTSQISDNNLLYFRKHFRALIRMYESYLIPLSKSMIFGIDNVLKDRDKEHLIPKCNNCNSDDLIFYIEDDDEKTHVACKNCHAELTDIIQNIDITYQPEEEDN